MLIVAVQMKPWLTRKLWSKLVHFISDHTHYQFELARKRVWFDRNLNSHLYLINLLIILTKLYRLFIIPKFSKKCSNVPLFRQLDMLFVSRML